MVVGGRTAVEVYFGLAMSGNLTGVKIFKAEQAGYRSFVVLEFCHLGLERSLRWPAPQVTVIHICRNVGTTTVVG